jgi:hypothetical protein
MFWRFPLVFLGCLRKNTPPAFSPRTSPSCNCKHREKSSENIFRGIFFNHYSIHCTLQCFWICVFYTYCSKYICIILSTHSEYILWVHMRWRICIWKVANVRNSSLTVVIDVLFFLLFLPPSCSTTEKEIDGDKIKGNPSPQSQAYSDHLDPPPFSVVPSFKITTKSRCTAMFSIFSLTVYLYTLLRYQCQSGAKKFKWEER